MRKIYTSPEIPEWIYPDEAINWLAWGRVPEVTHNTNGKCSRADLETVVENGHYFDLIPWPEEFDLLGEEIDYDRFYSGSSGVSLKPEDFDLAVLNSRQAEKMRREEVVFKSDAEYANSIMLSVQPLLDKATATVLLALQEGRISGRSVIWEDVEDYEIKVEIVPPSRWTYALLDTSGLHETEIIQLYTNDVLETFPEPIGILDMETGKKRMTCLIVESDNAQPPLPRKPRGRPRANGNVVENAVKMEIERLVSANFWPDKKEAQVACIQSFCKKLGTSSSRSAVQRLLKDAQK